MLVTAVCSLAFGSPAPATPVAPPPVAEARSAPVDPALAADPVWVVTHQVTCDECDGRSVWDATTPKADRLRRFVDDLASGGWSTDRILAWFDHVRPAWRIEPQP